MMASFEETLRANYIERFIAFGTSGVNRPTATRVNADVGKILESARYEAALRMVKAKNPGTDEAFQAYNEYFGAGQPAKTEAEQSAMPPAERRNSSRRCKWLPQ